MDWNKLDRKITFSEGYQFFKKHERLMIFIEGLFIIGLMFVMIMYVLQDRQIKEQIRDNCGYTTDKYDCVCDIGYVENWKKMQKGEEINLTIYKVEDV